MPKFLSPVIRPVQGRQVELKTAAIEKVETRQSSWRPKVNLDGRLKARCPFKQFESIPVPTLYMNDD